MIDRPWIPTGDQIELSADLLIGEFAVIDPPVPVEEIAKGTNLPVKKARLSEGLLGYISSYMGMTEIVVRRQDPLTRRRFTIAHEIGHQRLFGEVLEGGHLVPRLYRHDKTKPRDDPVERACDYFAACLLMPRGMVVSVADRAATITEMARLFQVSDDTMTFRLRELGLAYPRK